jgi:phosphohistidine swiveling domain-containing protein
MKCLSSFGLGEAIVSGIVTPDSYIVDSVKGKIIDKKIGEKKIALWLKTNGGIEEKKNEKPETQALSDNEILELTKLIKECETYYNKPMDIEWAFEKGKLYLLQSRPITTYFPFFKELLTEPGRNKRFYIDIMAMTQGFDEPMSVLGLELWGNMLDDLKMHMMTPQINGSTPIVYGKEYLSITAFQKILGKKQSAALINGYDGNLKKIFANIDLDEHPFEGKVEGTGAFKKTMVKTVLKMIPGAISGTYGDYAEGIRKYNKKADEIIKETNELSNKGDFSVVSRNALAMMTRIMGSASVVFSGMMSKRSISKIFEGEDVEKELSAMNMDLDGNPTSEMGHLLFAMASDEYFRSISSRLDFVDKSQQRNFPDRFLELYDEFMEKFAARGFLEIDVASKRIYEDVGMLYDKLIEINTAENQILTVKEKRQEAYDKLLAVAKQKGKEKKFIDAAARLKATFGYREHPKYMIVLTLAKVHDICLEIADVWVTQGRLDKAYDIFDLKADEITKAQKDLFLDLRDVREKNLSGYLTTNEWPLVIDSRGKIYKPTLEFKDGDFVGDAIAPGKVIGHAKVLHTPYEKPIESGEILVARATEPSWTPIFTNAAGVVMEIGGPLQHGGIIAREYGIPCVSGLMGIMDIIKDGDLLEVDGSNGVVRILESKE